jgi:hypothetical protein
VGESDIFLPDRLPIYANVGAVAVVGLALALLASQGTQLLLIVPVLVASVIGRSVTNKRYLGVPTPRVPRVVLAAPSADCCWWCLLPPCLCLPPVFGGPDSLRSGTPQSRSRL